MSNLLNINILERCRETKWFYNRWGSSIITNMEYFERFYGNSDVYEEFRKIIKSYSEFYRKIKEEMKTGHGRLIKKSLNRELSEVVHEFKPFIHKYRRLNSSLVRA